MQIFLLSIKFIHFDTTDVFRNNKKINFKNDTSPSSF